MVKLPVVFAGIATAAGKEGEDPEFVIKFKTKEFNADFLKLIPFVHKSGTITFESDQPELAGMNVQVGYDLPDFKLS
jgi:hypothetical protein